MNNLILHIDDLGLSKSTNSAVFQLNNKGLIFSGSLMPNTQGFQDFIHKYKDYDNKIDGSYNNLTRGIPLETIVEMLPDVGYKL